MWSSKIGDCQNLSRNTLGCNTLSRAAERMSGGRPGADRHTAPSGMRSSSLAGLLGGLPELSWFGHRLCENHLKTAAFCFVNAQTASIHNSAPKNSGYHRPRGSGAVRRAERASRNGGGGDGKAPDPWWAIARACWPGSTPCHHVHQKYGRTTSSWGDQTAPAMVPTGRPKP